LARTQLNALVDLTNLGHTTQFQPLGPIRVRRSTKNGIFIKNAFRRSVYTLTVVYQCIGLHLIV